MRRRARRFRGQQGSVHIEMLLFVPVVILIWTLLNFVFTEKKGAITAQRSARQCAWDYALQGCTGAPPAGCRIASRGAISDAELRRNARGAFDSIVARLPELARQLDSLHGDVVRVERQDQVARPGILGGSTTATGNVALLCGGDPERRVDPEEIASLVCEAAGTWCPGP